MTKLVISSVALLLLICSAKAVEQQKPKITPDDLMPEDFKKFYKLLEEDGLDVQDADPTDWSKWASVLSHVRPTEEGLFQIVRNHFLNQALTSLFHV
jgi:hypothetical protein